MKDRNYNNVVFYDGDCGFCAASVQFVLNRMKKRFYFCPLQSELAKKLLEPFNATPNLKTIYLLKDKKVYDRSSAALQIARDLKGGWPLLFGFYIVPKFMRDWVYDFIAKRRHKIKTNKCLLPAPQERELFIGLNAETSA